MRVVTTRFDLPDSLLAQIGRVAVLWSLLEWHLEDLIKLLSEMSKKRARIVTQGMNVRSRLMVITGLMQSREIDAAIATEFKAISNEIQNKDTEVERNQVIHSLWHYSEETDHWFAVVTAGSWTPSEDRTIRRSVLPESIPMDRAEVKAINDRLFALIQRTAALKRQVETWLATLQQKSEQPPEPQNPPPEHSP